MNQRKIQKTGIATYTVSLPKVWVNRNSVKPGDAVMVQEEDDQSLRIVLHERKSVAREAIMNLVEFSDAVEVTRKFTSYYLNGYTKVSFHAKGGISQEFRKIIIEQMRKVIGFEVMEETEQVIVVQDFFSADYLSIEGTVKRSFQLSKLMIQEARKIVNKEVHSLDNILAWEEEVNKLYLLARRQINFALHDSLIMNQLKINVKDCQDFIILSGAIEKMADSFLRIAASSLSIKNISKKQISQINAMYGHLLAAYEMAFESIFKKNFMLANKAIKLSEQILHEPTNIEAPQFDGDEKINLYVMISKLQTKTNFITEMAEIGLDRA